ncbi:unnamed protein product [Ambrosiozyma monospora]|uniref:Unnamed protein product n=1 Tax=Ambrosiozyma monospora TaxID=43982 RepID=A0A9W6WKR4_AMBMO|nr:unnamed protein product [Ambrosiozyma monospora]
MLWFFGDSLFDRFLKYTGGMCSNGDKSLNYRQCRNLNKLQLQDAGDDNPEPIKWVGGVKLSGHSLILSCFTMSLIYEFKNCYRVYIVNKLNDNVSHINFGSSASVNTSTSSMRLSSWIFHSLLALFTFYCCCWTILFCITAVFYHTVIEKIVGLSCGLFIPYLIYFKFRSFFNILL